ncbi:MAG: hypothetical protein QGF71_02020, partial [Rhodospirillales bacterium]|nr:hypothetical protein [Rhodospirillales bacterium]
KQLEDITMAWTKITRPHYERNGQRCASYMSQAINARWYYSSCMAVISFGFSLTATCPKTSWVLLAKACTRCNAERFDALSTEPSGNSLDQGH